MVYTTKEPKNNIYRQLIQYACMNNDIVSFKIEKHNYDVNEKQEYENIFYNILNLPKEELIKKANSFKFITEICNQIENNQEILKVIKYYFYKNIDTTIYTKRELEELKKILLKEISSRNTVEYMIYITIEIDMYNKNIQDFLESMQKNLVKIQKNPYKKGWRNYDVYYYKIDDNLKKKLLEVNSLYQWNFPELPSDLSFYKNEKIWMETITHEEICRIYTDDQEEIEKMREMGLKIQIEKN